MSKKSATTCSACGTSPVNHKLLFAIDFLDGTLGRLTNRKFTSSRSWHKIADLLEKALFALMSRVGLVHFSEDIEKASTGRSKLIWEEARRRSIRMEQAIALGKPVEFYRAWINGKLFFFQSLPIPPWLNQTGYLWLDDKFILSKKLEDAGISVPRSRKVFTWKNAQRALAELSLPVILKPKNGSRGRHTTTNIKTEEELRRAFRLCRQITSWMVIQEHLFGSVYRATVINGKLAGFFRADPPQVIGNGKSTISELIKEKNSARPERLDEIMIDEDLMQFIKRQDYDLDSVPKEGTIVGLSAKTGRMYGGYTEEMLPKVHPKMHEIFQKAGETVKAPVVGFDLIIEDPTGDPDTERWGIIECNSMPFIDLHYFPLEGTPINLAKNVWDLWEKQ